MKKHTGLKSKDTASERTQMIKNKMETILMDGES
jgi:hypothetical protein